MQSFEKFFVMIGPELSATIGFVCSDMWKPYLRVIREKCGQALHVLDGFHIVKLQKAEDDVPSAEAQAYGRWRVRTFTEEIPLVSAQTP